MDNNEQKTLLSTDISTNIENIKNILKDCDDAVYREFKVGGINGCRMFLFYIDGMSDKILLDNFVINPLMITIRDVKPDFDDVKNKIYQCVSTSSMAVTDFKEVQYIEDAVAFVLSGESVLLIDGSDKGAMIATKSWPARGVSEPPSETVIRGPRDGFTETLRMNTAIARRRIRDPKFKIKQKQVGVRSKTDIAIMYIDDIVDKRILDEVNKRIASINIDAILDSGYIQQFLEERQFTPFPQIQATERPDVVTAAIYEGRIGIIVDNSPFVLIVPTTLGAFFQSAEDYYSRPIIAFFVRLIRSFAAILAILAPGLYIAITTFNPGIIPSKLALSIAATREGVPFPAIVEAIIMELTFELLREAGIRLPRPIGSTIGIVGGLVIGQAAVTAGIVSPIMVIIVAITAIASFAISNYEVSAAFRMLRFFIMILSAVYGLYGMVIGIIAIFIHLVSIKSFGVPYLSPIAPLEIQDIKDSVFIRAPWKYMKKRPKHLDPNDVIRQGGSRDDSK